MISTAIRILIDARFGYSLSKFLIMETIKKTILSFGLRPATSDDTEFLYRLYGTTREEELNAAGFPPKERESFLRMQFNAQKTHYERFYPAAEHRIITTGKRAVGREYVNRADGEIFLVDLTLLPEFCGGGIGTALLEKLCAESAAAAKPFRLYVEKFNDRARRLYERLGFEEIDDAGAYLLLERRSNRHQAGPGKAFV